MALFRFYKFMEKYSPEDIYIVDTYKELLDTINEDRKQWYLEPLKKLTFSSYSASEDMVCDDKDTIVGFLNGFLDTITRNKGCKYVTDAYGGNTSPSFEAFQEVERKVNFLLAELQELKAIMGKLED